MTEANVIGTLLIFSTLHVLHKLIGIVSFLNHGFSPLLFFRKFFDFGMKCSLLLWVFSSD